MELQRQRPKSSTKSNNLIVFENNNSTNSNDIITEHETKEHSENMEQQQDLKPVGSLFNYHREAFTKALVDNTPTSNTNGIPELSRTQSSSSISSENVSDQDVFTDPDSDDDPDKHSHEFNRSNFDERIQNSEEEYENSESEYSDGDNYDEETVFTATKKFEHGNQATRATMNKENIDLTDALNRLNPNKSKKSNIDEQHYHKQSISSSNSSVSSFFPNKNEHTDTNNKEITDHRNQHQQQRRRSLLDTNCCLCSRPVAAANTSVVLMACDHAYHLQCYHLMHRSSITSQCSNCAPVDFHKLIVTRVSKNVFDRVSPHSPSASSLLCTVASSSHFIDSDDLRRNYLLVKQSGSADSMMDNSHYFNIDLNDQKMVVSKALARSPHSQNAALKFNEAINDTSCTTARDLQLRQIDCNVIKQSGTSVDVLITIFNCTCEDLYNKLGFTEWSDLIHIGIRPHHLKQKNTLRSSSSYNTPLFSSRALSTYYGHTYITMIQFLSSCHANDSLPGNADTAWAVHHFCTEMDYTTMDFVNFRLTNLQTLQNFGTKAFTATTYMKMCLRLIERSQSQTPGPDILYEEIIGPFKENTRYSTQRLGITSHYLFEELQLDEQDVKSHIPWWNFTDLLEVFQYRPKFIDTKVNDVRNYNNNHKSNGNRHDPSRKVKSAKSTTPDYKLHRSRKSNSSRSISSSSSSGRTERISNRSSPKNNSRSRSHKDVKQKQNRTHRTRKQSIVDDKDFADKEWLEKDKAAHFLVTQAYVREELNNLKNSQKKASQSQSSSNKERKRVQRRVSGSSSSEKKNSRKNAVHTNLNKPIDTKIIHNTNTIQTDIKTDQLLYDDHAIDSEFAGFDEL